MVWSWIDWVSKINYLKLDNPDNENSYTSEIMKLIDNKGIDKVIVTEPSTYDEMESIQHWQKTIETDVEIRKNDLFFCGIDEFEAWAEEERVEAGILLSDVEKKT